MHPVLQAALERLEKAKSMNGGQQINARCPAHQDKNPSLSLSEKGGKILWHCHAGCAPADVAAALQTLGIIVAKNNKALPEASYSPVPKSRWVPNYEALLGRKPEFIWQYLDASGENVLGYVCRWTGSEGQKEIRPIIPCRDEDGHVHWQVRAMPDPRPLYGLDLLAQYSHKPVLVVEGEKAADAGRSNPAFSEYVVVTWSGGAKAAAKTDWRPLKGRSVKIWPDNDDAGRKAAQDILAILRELNDA